MLQLVFLPSVAVHSAAQTARDHDPPGEDEPCRPHTAASRPQALPGHE